MTGLSILCDALVMALWRACWQGSLLVLAVWLICRIISSMPARLQCWFWRLVVLKFLMVLLCPNLLNLPLLPSRPIRLTAPIHHVGVHGNAGTQSISMQAEMPTASTHQGKIGPKEEIALPSAGTILCIFWIIGVGWSSARLLAAWRRTKQLRRQSQTIDSAPLTEELARQRRLIGLRGLPELRQVPGGGSPMLIGIFRPTILMPAETYHRLTAMELTMVLGHELAHIRRSDLLWRLAAAWVRVVFFFNPIIWLSHRRLNLAQEIAADQLAIARQDHDPVSYGRLLVAVVEKFGSTRLIPSLSVGTMEPVESLTRRLVAMMRVGRVSNRIVVSSAIVFGATVLLGVVPWHLVAAEPKPAEQQLPPPFVLSPQQEAQVDRVLKQWGQSNRDGQQIHRKFKRWTYDAVFGKPDQARFVELGTIRYAAPDKWLFRLDSAERDGKKVPIEDHRAEHWVRDGKSLFQYCAESKRVVEHRLMPQLQDTIFNSLLPPFLFGVQAQELQKRCFLRTITPAEIRDQIWLEAYPRTEKDAANFDHAQFIVAAQGKSPLAVKIFLVGKTQVSYQFWDIPTSDPWEDAGSVFRVDIPPGWERVPAEPPADSPAKPSAKLSSTRETTRSGRAGDIKTTPAVTREAILKVVPIGTSLREADRIMAKSGFTRITDPSTWAKPRPNGPPIPVGKVDDSRFVTYTIELPVSKFVVRQWIVELYHQAGKVDEVKVAAGLLTGP